MLWLGPDFAAKVEYARTKARVEALRDGPADTPLKMASDAGVSLPNKCLPRWCTSPQLLKHHLLMGEDARECVKKFPMDPAGSGTKTATSSPAACHSRGEIKVKSNWRPAISARPPSRRLIHADIAVPALSGGRLLPAERAAEAPPAGTTIFAFGSPLELKFSVSSGIVSGLGRTAGIRSGSTPMFEDFLQIDAPINPGNSGGPVTDTLGRVVGMSTAVADQDTGDGEGSGHSLSVDLIGWFLILSPTDGPPMPCWACNSPPSQGRPSGVLGASWLGPACRPTAIGHPGGPADRAGIRAGDLILSIDGRVTQNGSEVKEASGMQPSRRNSHR